MAAENRSLPGAWSMNRVPSARLAPAEGEITGIEDRQLVLVAVRRAQVEQARLQGLQERFAANTGFAIEEQAGIEAGDRQAAAGRGVAAQLFRGGGGRIDALRTQNLSTDAIDTVHQAAVQLVSGVAIGQGGGDVPGRAADRERHVRFHVQARAATDANA
ncbi:hypothetical protein G6F46_013859 [Rhizopus delemar]|nr:hypothetical protein G6F46_013859 [Rhizopus delemar]